MKILSLELNHFKRMSLNKIEHFSIQINNTLQVILGTNGSGKTQLLHQLTPLPANAADFEKHGSKIIKIEHHNSLYELSSVFSPSQKHSFIKDNIELNEGGTITVQKELVKTYFKITPDIHSLMLGEETFTEMSPSRRKEWFITLCDTNYDYAIKIYNKIKERHRDTSGALKIAKKKIIHETEKIIKTEEEEKIKNEVKSLHDQLNYLLEYRKPIESDIDVLKIKQTDFDTQLIQYSKTLSNLLDLNGASKKYTDEKLIDLISIYNTKIISAQTLIEQYTKEYDQNYNKIIILEKAEQQTINTLLDKIKEVENYQDILKNKLIFISKDFDATTALNSFLSIKNTLSDIFSAIPNNTDKKYNSTTLNQSRETLKDYTIRKASILETLTEHYTKQKHMHEHKDKPDTTCPNCNHKFSLHYNELAFQNIESTINQLTQKLETSILPKISELETYISDCTQYSILYRQYTHCIQNISILKPYWDYLQSKNTITNNPLSGITELGIIENDLKYQLEYTHHNHTLSELSTLYTSLKDVGDDNLKTLQSVNATLQNSIETHTEALQSALNTKTKYTTLQSRNKEIKSLCEKIQDCISKKTLLHKEEIETLRRTILNDTIRILQSDLASKEHILTQIKTQQSIIENLYLNINELELEELALSTLVKQLSPADGLIAEGLFGFIHTFINQMNTLIKKVWSYPMVIQTCKLSDDNSIDLDYKFPIELNTDKTPVPDISKGSTGMVEFINLIFKCIASKYLHLQDYPLMLDELGRTLDNHHKTELFTFIHNLIEQQTFSQMFIVSHDFSHYGALPNADICVLDATNILVPKTNTKINHHVKIIY